MNETIMRGSKGTKETIMEGLEGTKEQWEDQKEREK
jgi:hypothetical protein